MIDTVTHADGKMIDRAKGVLLGLAVGDALGTTLEFRPRDEHPLHTRMIGGGPFELEPGQWTDDTAMALALASSLLERGRFDAHDLAARFVAWWRNGAYSCTGTCFDIGVTTEAALARFEHTGDPYAGSPDEDQAGNGSLMRLAPAVLFYVSDANAMNRAARDQSRITHAAPQALDACVLFAGILREAIRSGSVTEPAGNWNGHPALGPIIDGKYRRKTREEIRSSGYVVDTLEAALWAVYQTRTFEEALILAVNLGNDADTVGAVTGQLAGALYGASAIPDRWLAPLSWRDQIASTAVHLLV